MAKKNASEATVEPPRSAPRRARLQRFEARDIQRSQIRKDPENPRYLDVSGRVGLRRVLDEHGLVDTIVWNEQTGELAGGHQRLDLLDADENYYEERDGEGHLTLVENDYVLTVAVINVPRARQRELNLALNNPDIQGMYDLDLMTNWLMGGEVNPFSAGFTEASIEDSLGPDVLNAVLAQYKEPEVLDQAERDVATTELTNPEAAAKVAAEIDLIKQRKHDWVENNREGNDPDHMLIVVFTGRQERGEFMTMLEFDPGKRFLPFDVFVDHFQQFAAKFAVSQALATAGYDPEKASRALTLREMVDFQRYLVGQISLNIHSYLQATGTSERTLQPQEPDHDQDQTADPPTEPDAGAERVHAEGDERPESEHPSST